MNCKPGDLAVVVVDEDFKANIGVFVEVIKRVSDIEGFPAWEVRPLTPVMCWHYPGRESNTASLTEPGELVDWADCELQPIRDPGEDVTDEMVQLLGKPQEVTA